MSEAAKAIEELVHRETRAWNTKDLDLLLSGYDLSAADDRELNQLLDFAGPAPPLPPPPKVAPAAAANADVIDTGHRMMDLLLDI